MPIPEEPVVEDDRCRRDTSIAANLHRTILHLSHICLVKDLGDRQLVEVAEEVHDEQEGLHLDALIQQ